MTFQDNDYTASANDAFLYHFIMLWNKNESRVVNDFLKFQIAQVVARRFLFVS